MELTGNQRTAAAAAACLALVAACGSGAISRVEERAPPGPVALRPLAAPVPRGSIAAGGQHVCATAAGRVACWGHADHGQLGPAITTDQPRPVLIDGLDDIAGVSASFLGSCAWTKRGAVWCWGTFGRARQPLARVPGIDDAVQVALGDDLGCVLRRDGRVACWATASCSTRSAASPPDGATPARLRRGNEAPEEVACGLLEIDTVAGAAEIAIAGLHACARTEAEVRCWKGNRGEPFVLPVPPGATSLAGARQRVLYSGSGFATRENIFVLAGDSVAGWTLGVPGGPQRVRGHFAPGASRIAAGSDRVCTIGASVTCWSDMGEHQDHQLAAVDLGVGSGASCVRTTGDRIACWGATEQIGDGGRDRIEAPVEVTGITDAVQLASGGRTACVRRANGRVACWGDQLVGAGLDAVPADAGLDRAVDLVIGHSHACAIIGDGTTACWGRDNAGDSMKPIPPTRIPGLAGAARLSAEAWSTCAVRADHRIACHGDDRRGKPPPDRAVELWHNADIACRRRPDRAVSCRTSHRESPLELGADVARLAIVDRTVCAVRTSGAVDCYDDFLRAPPRRVPGIDDAVAIASGGLGERTCVVRAAGTVACWSEEAREAGKPAPLLAVPGLTDAVDVAVGWSYACALRRDRRVSCWGRPDHLGDGSRSRRETPVLLPRLARPRS